MKWALLGSALAWLFAGAIAAQTVTRVGVDEGYSPDQPIAFSHRLHAGDARVPCLYCHYAAPRSQHAGIPPAGVCMNCHALLTTQTVEIQKLREAVLQSRPIAWVKVHNLPDFVHFDHSQHVGAAVPCRACHGAVEAMDRVRQEMPLAMGWCLDCHEARGVGEHGGRTDCIRCHY
jgi:hypothetical protein